MYHPVFSYVKLNMTFTNFVTERQTGIIGLLHELIQNDFQGIKKLRIRAEHGNGSGHLLHAIGNELKAQNIRISILEISKGDSWNELGIRHFNIIRGNKIVLIHHLDRVLMDPEFGPQFLEFYKSFENEDTVLIYTSTSDFDESQEPKLIEFLENTNEIYIEPLTAALKKKWVKSLFDEDFANEIPEELFLEKISNHAFIERIEALKIKKVKEVPSGSHTQASVILDIMDSRYRKALQIKLKQLDLELKKNQLIKEQKYEAAANVRNEILELNDQLKDILEQMKTTLNNTQKCPENIEVMIRVLSYINLLRSNYEDSVRKWLDYAEDQLNTNQLSLTEDEEKTDWKSIIHQLKMKLYQMRK